MTDLRAISLFNTLTRRVEPVTPLVPGELKVYNCGPTIYDYVHIGNLRTFLFQDLAAGGCSRPPATGSSSAST